jgi:hypothetical protein
VLSVKHVVSELHVLKGDDAMNVSGVSLPEFAYGSLPVAPGLYEQGRLLPVCPSVEQLAFAWKPPH